MTEIAGALLHHLQSDGAMDRAMLAEGIESLRAKLAESQENLRRVQAAARAGMDAATRRSHAELEAAQRLRAESRPEALESERDMNARLTEELAEAQRTITGYEELVASQDAFLREYRALQNDPWRWVGDGFDFPDSLSSQCPVLMTSDKLRELLKQLADAQVSADLSTEFGKVIKNSWLALGREWKGYAADEWSALPVAIAEAQRERDSLAINTKSVLKRAELVEAERDKLREFVAAYDAWWLDGAYVNGPVTDAMLEKRAALGELK